MKLSTRARYALRAMIVISREAREGKPVNLAAVSRETGISRRYLEQVTIALKNAKILKAVPGKFGGHQLGKPAGEISLLEIVETAIGEINVVECALEQDSCEKSGVCECRQLYCEINDAIKSTLAKYTLLDLQNGEAGCPLDG